MEDFLCNKLHHQGVLSSGLPTPRFLPPPFAKGPTILTTTRESFIIMENGDPLPYLFDFMSVTRLVSASFLPMLRFAHLLTTVPLEFSESVPPLEQQLIPSHSSRSRCLYNIYLGLYPYVRHGGRSGLEIAVDSHEGAVPFSTLPTIYRGQHYSLLSV
jgi:hypothetical protein